MKATTSYQAKIASDAIEFAERLLGLHSAYATDAEIAADMVTLARRVAGRVNIQITPTRHDMLALRNALVMAEAAALRADLEAAGR
jgi:hypothetical protein